MFESPDPELDTALELAKSNPDQAALVLRIAAKYLYKQEKLPYALACYLADAFEKSMRMASVVRGSELLINLNLKVMNRRSVANFEHIGLEFDQLIAANVSRNLAIEKLADVYAISPRTVERKIAVYRGVQENESAYLVAEQQHYSKQ
jgi:hypothetical protein